MVVLGGVLFLMSEVPVMFSFLIHLSNFFLEELASLGATTK